MNFQVPKNVLIKFNFLFNNIVFKIIRFFLLFLIILTLLGIPQYLDIIIYDFNFKIRPQENPDDRIIIVEWDEKSIQILEETIISDDTLYSLLQKIYLQQPRVIGLDIYRDLPVFSPRLEDRNNVDAYNKLQELFRIIPNLIGIEKVVNPVVNPPRVLKNKGFVAASDIPSDRDYKIRRSYVFPNQTEDGKPAGVPYLGVALGFQYLSAEGWNAVPYKKDPSILSIVKSNKSVEINQLKNFSGIDENDKYGYHFLINWRKNNAPFNRVSVIDVVSDKVDVNLFNNKLVIIGNVSESSADRHFLGYNRWKIQPWSYGVEIPAQVASSIISLALDNRPLINPINKFSEYIVLISLIFIYFIYFSKLLYNDLEIDKIYPSIIIYGICLLICLFIINVIAFSQGIWISMGVPLISTFIIAVLFAYYSYFKRKEENVHRLECYVSDLHHSLGNPLGSIRRSINKIDKTIYSIISSLEEYEMFGYDLDTDNLFKDLETISNRNYNLSNQAKKIQRYRSRLAEFIEYSYLSIKHPLELIDVNIFIENVITQFINENDYEHHVTIIKMFDHNITTAKIDPIALEIILENLMDNAFYAVTPQKQDFLSTVIVGTKFDNKFIKFIIEDNGAGIPKHFQSKIFQPFKSFRQKQGIGLYLCKKILNLYGGDIWVSSNNNGAKFTFVLPYIK